MASTSKVIKITASSAVKGQALVVRNRTTGESLNTTVNGTAKAVIDLQNLPSGFTSGDIIDISISGERVGSAALTTSEDAGQSVTITNTAMSTTITRGVR